MHCHCRQAGEDNPVGIMNAHTHEKGGFMVSYNFMQMQMRGLQQGTTTISNETVFRDYLMSPISMQMNMHMLMVMYGLSDRFSVMIMAGYSTSAMDMEMFASSHHHTNGNTNPDPGNLKINMKSKGWNDPTLFVNYQLMDKGNHQLILSAGLGFPLGNIYIRDTSGMTTGQRCSYAMQMGSGTWDILPGISYLFHKDKLSLGSQLNAVIRTGYNKNNYRLGDNYQFSSWLVWRWKDWISTSMRMEGIYTESIHGYDPGLYEVTEPSAKTSNYGGMQLNALPGVNFYLQNGFFSGTRLGFEFGYPLYQNLNGIQMAVQYQWKAGLQYIF